MHLRIEYISADLELRQRYNEVDTANNPDAFQLKVLIQNLRKEDAHLLDIFNYKGYTCHQGTNELSIPTGTKMDYEMQKIHSIVSTHTGLIA